MPLNRKVRELRREIGHVWKTPSTKDDVFWLITEVGELTDALMRLDGFPDVAPTRDNPGWRTLGDVAYEAADVLIMLTSLCDSLGINLFLAFERKLYYLRDKYGTEAEHVDAKLFDEGVRMLNEQDR